MSTCQTTSEKSANSFSIQHAFSPHRNQWIAESPEQVTNISFRRLSVMNFSFLFPHFRLVFTSFFSLLFCSLFFFFSCYPRAKIPRVLLMSISSHYRNEKKTPILRSRYFNEKKTINEREAMNLGFFMMNQFFSPILFPSHSSCIEPHPPDLSPIWMHTRIKPPVIPT